MSQLFRIHSQVADSYHSCIKLWYLCRALDASGCGVVRIDTLDCAETLGVSSRTIENYLKQGKNLYHRIIKTEKGKYTLYLKSLSTVTFQRGLDSFGVVGYITIDDLKTLRVAATEIVAIGGQKSSKYLASTGATENPNQNKPGEVKTKQKKPIKTATPEEIFRGTGLVEEASSQLSYGALAYDPIHATLFVGEKFTNYGVSQSYIADKLTRNRRTINRRLSNSIKLQIAKTDNLTYAESRIAAEEEREYGRYIRPSRSLSLSPAIAGRVYKLTNNIYYPKYELSSMKASRRAYKARVQSHIGVTRAEDII